MRFARAAGGPLTSLTLFFIVCAKYQVWAASDWCYEDPDCDPSHWAGVCKTGKSQSPIDFNTTQILAQQRIDKKRLRFDADYIKTYDKFYILNNGHTVQIQLEEQPTSHCLVDGAGFKGSYVFAQMHFHWGRTSASGSEHTVDGRHYPIEAHFVHYADKYESLSAALQDNNRRAVAVLGIFFQVGSHDNPALKSIVDALPAVTKPDKSIKQVEGKLNLTAILPPQLSLWRYEGSLTTPSCAEKVVWSVFRSPVPISENQLKEFRLLLDSHQMHMVNNYRPVQPIARRAVKLIEIDRMEVKAHDEHNEIDDQDPDDIESNTNPATHGHGIDHETTEHDDKKAHSKKDGKGGATTIQSSGLASILVILFSAMVLRQS